MICDFLTSLPRPLYQFHLHLVWSCTHIHFFVYDCALVCVFASPRTYEYLMFLFLLLLLLLLLFNGIESFARRISLIPFPTPMRRCCSRDSNEKTRLSQNPHDGFLYWFSSRLHALTQNENKGINLSYLFLLLIYHVHFFLLSFSPLGKWRHRHDPSLKKRSC